MFYLIALESYPFKGDFFSALAKTERLFWFIGFSAVIQKVLLTLVQLIGEL